MDDCYIKGKSISWTAEQLDWSIDERAFPRLSQPLQDVVKKILAFFITGDGIVNLNITQNYLNQVTLGEMKNFYILQMEMEVVHAKTYQAALERLVPDETEQDMLIGGFMNIPAIKDIANFCNSLEIDTFAERNFMYAIVEGVLFIQSFVILNFLKKLDVLPTLSLSNDFIQRDENLHRDFAVLVNKSLNEPITQKSAEAILCKAMVVVENFIRYVMPTPIMDLSVDKLIQHCRHVADCLLEDFMLEPIYHVNTPLEYAVNSELLRTETAFFEKKGHNYFADSQQKLNSLFGDDM
jgi:ribonucleoside-diphosphate reductase beta chain